MSCLDAPLSYPPAKYACQYDCPRTRTCACHKLWLMANAQYQYLNDDLGCLFRIFRACAVPRHTPKPRRGTPNSLLLPLAKTKKKKNFPLEEATMSEELPHCSLQAIERQLQATCCIFHIDVRGAHFINKGHSGLLLRAPKRTRESFHLKRECIGTAHESKKAKGHVCKSWPWRSCSIQLADTQIRFSTTQSQVLKG